MKIGKECTLQRGQSGGTVNSAAWFTVHQLIGTYGIAFATPYVVASVYDVLRLFGRLYSARSMYFILTGTPFFPVQILFAALIGCLAARHFKHRVMVWVWVIPLAVLVYSIVAVPTFTPAITPSAYQAGVGQSRFSHYFGWGCQPVNRCMDQTIVTLPFYVALSYSFGALFAWKLPKRFQRPNPRHFWVYALLGLFFMTAFLSELWQVADLLRLRQPWHWIYLQPLLVVLGSSVLLFLYSLLVARSTPIDPPGRPTAS